MANEIEAYTNFLFYNSEDGKTSIQVIADADAETIWTTQKGMAQIFGVEVPAISKHLKNIFDSRELDEKAFVSKMEITADDGKKYLTNCYNLDAIISVGYRVNSLQATRFRQWATGVLKEFMIKGFALDDERLKQGGTVFGKRYFDELLERIREIRASERMFYQKLTDIFAQSYDYDKTAQITFDFYSSIQNKLEYAVIGQTAAEIIIDRADSRKEHMGLKTWRDVGKGGKIQLSDTYVAKNYMTREELSELNQLVNICLDNAELSVKRGRPISMQGWVEQVNAILSLHGYTLLTGKGTRSSADAKAHAKAEYEKFRPIQDEHFVSDFDKMVAKTLKNKH